MSKHSPHMHSIATLHDANVLFETIGCDPDSFPIMAPKAVFHVIQLDEVMLQDAIIIKQDMLSIGGEVAIPKDAFQLKQETASIAIMGTHAQHQLLVKKLKRHYPRIQKIAEELHQILIGTK